ncbi:MAG: TRAP transporter large permease subunit, partial [Alphaproteobacteria bacterium]
MAEADLAHFPTTDQSGAALSTAPAHARSALQKGCDLVAMAVSVVLVGGLVAELSVVVAEIALRFWFERSLLWSDEVSRLFLASVAFNGGALAYRARQHTSVEFLTRMMPRRAQALVAATIDAVVLATAATVGVLSYDFMSISGMSTTPMLQINAAWLVLPLTVGMGLMVLFAVERLLCAHARSVAVIALIGVGVAGALIYAASVSPSWQLDTDVALAGMLAVFLAAVLLGLPVSFAMLAGSAAFLLVTGVAPTIAVAQNAQDGTGNFILLTLPFFIWAGLVMERGGISLRLVRFAMALVGHIRGGLLQVVVLTIFMVSGISGSKIADVVAVGSVLRRELKARGYAPEHGAAVLAASAAMSETIPPSIAMLVLGSVAPISIGTLFIAGIAPAAVIAVLLMALNYTLARRAG